MYASGVPAPPAPEPPGELALLSGVGAPEVLPPPPPVDVILKNVDSDPLDPVELVPGDPAPPAPTVNIFLFLK